MIGIIFRRPSGGSVHSGTPLLYATLAEVMEERAGIVNLGLEGVMLMGAVVGFTTTAQTGNAALAFWLPRWPGGCSTSSLGSWSSPGGPTNWRAAWRMMFCGVGLSALLGAPYIGSRIKGLNEVRIPLLSDLPVVGPIFFNYDILVYLAGPDRRADVVGALFHPLGFEPTGGGGKSHGGLCRRQKSLFAPVPGAVYRRDAGGHRRGAPIDRPGQNLGGMDDRRPRVYRRCVGHLFQVASLSGPSPGRCSSAGPLPCSSRCRRSGCRYRPSCWICFPIF